MYQLLDGEMCYGVRVGETHIPDISPNRDEVQTLLELLSGNAVAEEHVFDVIEVWFAMQAYSEIE